MSNISKEITTYFLNYLQDDGGYNKIIGRGKLDYLSPCLHIITKLAEATAH